VSRVRFADLPRGFVIAHRGGALQVAEHTLEGYRVAVAQGLPVIEQDVQVLADGALGVMHDGTVDRTTTSSGNVADHTAASWKQLRLDAGAYLGGGWPNDLRPPLFEEVLEEFGGSTLLCPEAKAPDTMGPMLDAMERAGVSRESVLTQSYSLADCRLAVQRRWPALWLGCTDPAQAAAAGIGWVGVRAGVVTPAMCRSAAASGVGVAAYTVNRRFQWEILKEAGVDAVFSDDPLYLHSDAPSVTDRFDRQEWLPGLQADGAERGRFYPDDASYGFDLDGGAGSWALVGYLRPPDPAAFTLDLAVRIEAAAPDGRASVFLSTTDRPFTGDAAPGVDGWQLVVHGSGGLEVHEVTDGVPVLLATAPGSPAVGGEYLRLQASVGGGSVRFAHTGSATGGDGGEAVAPAGAEHTPLPFTHLGRRGAAVRFKDLRFTDLLSSGGPS